MTLLDVLDPAIGAVLIREVPQRPGRLSFSHALIEHTLYDDLGPHTPPTTPPSHRRRSGSRCTATTRATISVNSPTTGRGRANLLTPTRPSTTRCGPVTTRCGKLAPDDAVAWYGQALELIDGQPLPDEQRRCETLVRLGTAQRQAADPRSRKTLLGAAHVAERLGSPALLARAALANSRGRPSSAGAVDQDRIDALEAALTATTGAETPERAMLLATLASEVYWDDMDRARTLSDEALVMARHADDDVTLWQVLDRREGGTWSPATLDERITNAHEQRDIANRLGDRHFHSGAALKLAYPAVCSGDLVDADKHYQATVRAAAETGLPAMRSSAAGYLSWRRLLAGQIEDAEQAADEALQLESQSQPDAFAYYAGRIYSIRRAQGRLGEIIELVERTVAENPGLPAFRAALAHALCELDRRDDAGHAFEPLVAGAFSAFRFDSNWLTAMTLCADAAAYLEHQTAAEFLVDLLAPWRDQFAFNVVTCEGSVARPLGLSLATAGRFDEADEAFAQAAAIHERIDAPIELARTRVNWARMLASRGQPGDPDRARPLLEGALTTATRLGLATIERQAQTLLAAAFGT